MTRAATRAGFGLIELLVVLAIITTLAALGLMVWPGIRDQDKVKDTATIVSIHLKDAQGRAAKKRSPVGVRFVVAPAGPGLAPKVDPMGLAQNQWVTELQFVELPDPLIPNPKPLTTTNPATEPRVRFVYTTDSTGAIAGPVGTPVRRCFLENVTQPQADQVETGCTLVMSAFGSWHRIIGLGSRTAAQSGGAGLFDQELSLEVFPDAAMGGATNQVIYHFAIYLLATPLVGEKPIPLPTDICVDLNLSIGPQSTTASFDVIFGPDGRLVSANTGQLFLYVRNYTKEAIYTGTGASLSFKTGPTLVTAFRRGGEQHIVSIRNTGAIGHAPVFWPDTNGVYPPGPYPPSQPLPFALYTLARREQNQD